MKRFFITVLFVGLFVTVNTVWASGDNKKDKAPAKVENAEKKACASTGEGKACCAEKKEGEAKACCSEKKDGKANASCCAEKKEGKATSCTNKEAASGTKSSGKKAN